ncbi:MULTISPECIES: hypothetical protein [unclassified Bradyrhizobium]
MKFYVMRQHIGDKPYAKGDIREADETEVKHLVEAGVLSKDPPKAKGEVKPKNKAEAAPKNKAAE